MIALSENQEQFLTHCHPSLLHLRRVSQVTQEYWDQLARLG